MLESEREKRERRGDFGATLSFSVGTCGAGDHLRHRGARAAVTSHSQIISLSLLLFVAVAFPVFLHASAICILRWIGGKFRASPPEKE